jgi:hypothetical protein
MAVRKRLLAAVLGVGVMGVIGLSARASSVSIDTGANMGWQLQGGAFTDTTALTTLPQSVYAPTPNGAWLSAATVDAYAGESSPGALWISSSLDTEASAGTYTFFKKFLFSDFNPSPVGATDFVISGVLSVDNRVTNESTVPQIWLVDGLKNLKPLSLVQLTGPADPAYGFESVFSLDGMPNLNDPFYLVVEVTNDSNGSMGLIVAGHVLPASEAGAVPLPASVYSGLSVLGLMAAYKLRRKLA